MKKEFSVKWIGSKQPRKQRKYRANAPLHIKRKFMAANLSKELRKRYGNRSFPLKKGDSVRIMRGEFKGKTAKIEYPDYKRTRTTIEGIFRTKKDGTKVSVYFAPSNLQIKELNLEDIKRKNSIDRKVGNKSKVEKDKDKENINKDNKGDKK